MPDRLELVLAVIFALLAALSIVSIAQGIGVMRRARDCAEQCYPFISHPSADGCVCSRDPRGPQ